MLEPSVVSIFLSTCFFCAEQIEGVILSQIIQIRSLVLLEQVI